MYSMQLIYFIYLLINPPFFSSIYTDESTKIVNSMHALVFLLFSTIWACKVITYLVCSRPPNHTSPWHRFSLATPEWMSSLSCLSTAEWAITFWLSTGMLSRLHPWLPLLSFSRGTYVRYPLLLRRCRRMHATKLLANFIAIFVFAGR